MKVTKQDLKNFGLLDKLPELLQNMGDRDFYVIYYSVNEEDSKLEIHSSEVVREVKETPYEYLDLDFLYHAKTTIEKALTATENEIWISMLEKEVKDYKMIQS
jgi:hypothetical protein